MERGVLEVRRAGHVVPPAVDVAGVPTPDLQLLGNEGCSAPNSAPAFHVKQPPLAWPDGRLRQSCRSQRRAAQRVDQVVFALGALPTRRSASLAARMPRWTQVDFASLFHVKPRRVFAAESVPAGVVHEAELAADFRQARVGVVLPQLQAELGAAGEHPVGLGHALGGQVVHQHAEARPGPAPAARGVTPPAARRSARRTGRCRFLIARRAIDLASKEQPWIARVSKLLFSSARVVEVVVLDGVAGADDVGVLQAGMLRGWPVGCRRAGWWRCRWGELVRGRAFSGSRKIWCESLSSKRLTLSFSMLGRKRGRHPSITREHRAAVKAAADDLVRALVGVRDPAGGAARGGGG